MMWSIIIASLLFRHFFGGTKVACRIRAGLGKCRIVAQIVCGAKYQKKFKQQAAALHKHSRLLMSCGLESS